MGVREHQHSLAPTLYTYEPPYASPIGVPASHVPIPVLGTALTIVEPICGDREVTTQRVLEADCSRPYVHTRYSYYTVNFSKGALHSDDRPCSLSSD